MRKEILLVFVLMTLLNAPAAGQKESKQKLKVKKGMQVVLRDTAFITRKDTVIYLTNNEAKKIKIRQNPYLKSGQFYDSLARKASGNKVTNDIFEFVVKKRGRKEKLVSAVVKSEETFKSYAGYTIGSIVVKSVDLLEGSVVDTLQKTSTNLGKFINRIHTDTRSRIIKQNLLFDVGDVVDPYQLADNERILRQFKTLRDARIYLKKNKKEPNVVDVIVVTQDVASIGVSGDYSSFKKYRFDVYDINILGYARQLQVSYFRSSEYTPKNGYEIILREPNFFKTFIQGELQYTNNYIRERTRITLGRDFFAPEIKYAGGVDVYRTNENFYAESYDTLKTAYTENSIDVWAGRSFEFKKRMNIIFSARINPRNFIERPFVSADSNTFFFDRTLVLGSTSLTKRNFLKSLRIRGFGRTEDIPTGGAVSLIFGKEFNEFIDRPYFEVRGTWGKYFTNIGYINLAFTTGSFYKNSIPEDGLVTVDGTYFSNLFKWRKMQVRQFLFINYTKGLNRILDRTITLEGKWEDSNALPPLGNEKLSLGFETVYFTSWYVYGFQFALFHRFDLNMLINGQVVPGNFELSQYRTTVFPTIRSGVRILNENLVLPLISIELGYYGKNKNFGSAWEFKFSTTLPDLFGTSQVFKPTVTRFE